MCQFSSYNKHLHESHICSPKGDISNYLKISIFPLFGNGKIFSENLSKQSIGQFAINIFMLL